MTTTYAVLSEGLEKSFGEVHALRGLDLAVPEGTVCGLLGPNGAGKTTAVRILATLTAPTGGRALVAGHDVTREPAAVRRAIGVTGQYASVDGDLTGRENLRLFARLHRTARLREPGPGRRAAGALRARRGRRPGGLHLVGRHAPAPGPGRRSDHPPPRCSSSTSPPPASTRRPASRSGPRCGRSPTEGTTVLLTTQYLEEADRLADEIVVVDRGRVVATGTPAQLKARIGARAEVVVAARDALAGAAAVLDQLTGGRPVARRGAADRRRGRSSTRAHPAPDHPRTRHRGRAGSRTRACARPPSTRCSSASRGPAPTRCRPDPTRPRRSPNRPRPSRRPGVRRMSTLLSDGGAVLTRQLQKARHAPALLILTQTMPITMLLFFGYVFGSALAMPGAEYREFLVPGAARRHRRERPDDRHVHGGAGRPPRGDGPVPDPADEPDRRAARADGGRPAHHGRVSMVPLMLVGLAMGWRIEERPARRAGGPRACCCCSASPPRGSGTYLGLLSRSEEAAGQLGSATFVLPMLSSAYLPTDGLPGWLRTVAEWNPISAVATALSASCAGTPGRRPDGRGLARRASRRRVRCSGRGSSSRCSCRSRYARTRPGPSDLRPARGTGRNRLSRGRPRGHGTLG